MNNVIEKFQGEHRFLSNFWPSKVWLDGMEYPTVEHAYQAAKTDNNIYRRQIQAAANPTIAKQIGRKVPLAKDWDSWKLWTMEYLLRQKFADPSLRSLLKLTGDAILIEGNIWGDTYWGVCWDRGQNQLGRLLMQIRGELM